MRLKNIRLRRGGVSGQKGLERDGGSVGEHEAKDQGERMRGGGRITGRPGACGTAGGGKAAAPLA